MIKDSGKRRAFKTGAVRDIAEGKGRCDLMPLDVVAVLVDDDIICNIASASIKLADSSTCSITSAGVKRQLKLSREEK